MSKSSRKLAAIVFTDIAGFTELSARDELKALKLLENQRKIFQPMVAEFEGSWLKEMGDGLLLSFDSSLNAVRCAVAMQQAAQQTEGLRLRIGIHQGDIVLQGTEVLGDGVNIASRIEPLAPVGGVALSEKIQQDISSHPEFVTKLLGKPELKGVAQALNVFCITSHGLPEGAVIEAEDQLETAQVKPAQNYSAFWAAAIGAMVFVVLGITVPKLFVPTDDTGQRSQDERGGAEKPAGGAIPDDNSIAILPFKAHGNGTSSIWADGVPDDIRRHLSRVKELKVISRRSSEVFRNELKTAKEIAERLGARWLLVGTVHHLQGEELSISVELTQGNEIKWSNKWSRVAFKELLRVQEDIARGIAKHMGHKIPPIQIASAYLAEMRHNPRLLKMNDQNGTQPLMVAKSEMPPRTPTKNFKAWVVYLEGRQHWIKRTDDGLLKAREKFLQATILDNRFALAHCYLGYTDMMMGVYHVEKPMDVMPRAKQSLQRALELDPHLGEAHAAMGYIQLLFDWDFAGSRNSFEKAIKYNPNHGFTYCWYSQYFAALGDTDKRIEMTRKSYDREPLNPVIATVHASAVKKEGRRDEALALLEQTVETHPGCLLPVRYLAFLHFKDKKYDKARALFHKVRSLLPHRVGAEAGVAGCLLKLGRKEEAKVIFDKIIQSAKTGNDYVPPRVLCWIYEQLDERNSSFNWVQYMVDNKCPSAIWLQGKQDDKDEFLHGPRLEKVLEQVGLQKYKANLDKP